MAPLYRLPLREPKNLSAIKDLLAVLDRIEEVCAIMTPELLEMVQAGKTPNEYSLKLAEFRRDVAEGKEKALENFPTL